MRGAVSRSGRIGLALALIGGAAFAQDTPVKKPRRPQPPAASGPQTAPADAGATTSATTPDLRGPASLTPPAGEDASLPKSGLPATPPPALRSAVRSRWSTPATIASRGGGACRAQCATTRLACLAPATQDDVPRCNAQWTSCLSTCDGLAYGRAPSSPP